MSAMLLVWLCHAVRWISFRLLDDGMKEEGGTASRGEGLGLERSRSVEGERLALRLRK